MRASNLKELRDLINSDHYRVSGKKPGILHALYHAFRHPYDSLAFLFWLRVFQYGGLTRYFAAWRCKVISRVRCVDFPLSLDIGYGLYLGHFKCMVINPKAKIGNNVNLSQFLNIGSNEEKTAIIGDNVYVGPHVCIVEDVEIGDNATIGAGAVVTRDIPENATAAGVPAKVLNYRNPGRYVPRRWPIAPTQE